MTKREHANMNMSFTNWWRARGKSDARDGKPNLFETPGSEEHSSLARYTQCQKAQARDAYDNGYEGARLTENSSE